MGSKKKIQHDPAALNQMLTIGPPDRVYESSDGKAVIVERDYGSVTIRYIFRPSESNKWAADIEIDNEGRFRHVESGSAEFKPYKRSNP